MRKSAKVYRFLFWMLLIVVAVVAAVYVYATTRPAPGGSYSVRLMVGEQAKEEGIKGRTVGGNYMYVDAEGERYTYVEESLIGLDTLDRSDAVVTLPADAQTLTIYFEKGGAYLNSVDFFYFDSSVMHRTPDTTTGWNWGQALSYTKHDTAYRMEDPKPGIYVARCVWDYGVMEYAWLLVEAE